MTRAVKARLVAFVVLSAVGIVYIAASYLGFVDKVLGRGVTVEATLPTSGGLFTGSEVTYRGVKIGKVSKVRPTGDGILLTLSLKDGTELPLDSPMYVHNLSAVGEQYLDFEPADDEGPYAENGDRLEGSAESIPVDEADLLIELDAFVNSVDKPSLRTVVSELGQLFDDTGQPLQKLLDNGGTFVDAATENTPYTIALLDRLRTVLGTQAENRDNITSFSRDLNKITRALRDSDADLRTVVTDTPPAVRELQRLLEDLEPTIPILLSNAISVQQVAVSHLRGLEQLLVTFPRVIAGGFTGTTPDGYGHVNLQYDNDPGPCTDGYKPKSQWRQGNDLTDSPIFPARCARFDQTYRGFNYSPGTRANPNPGRVAVGYYDPRTGMSDSAVDRRGNPVRLGSPPVGLLGEDAWKWMLVGPVVDR